MDLTAPTILEIGVVLLLAAAAGWLSRRLGLPAVLGYLVTGLAVSPFTPGYVADRGQLQLLADVGVVLLMFEVGIEVDVPRLRREQRGLLWAAPLQVAITTAIVAVVALAAGVVPFGAILVGLSVAFSSSVVIVNITRSRSRTTDRPTEEALMGWSVLQDVTGVLLTVVVLAIFGFGDRPIAVALGALVAFGVVVVAAAWILPRILDRLHELPDLFLIVSVAVGLTLAGAGAVWFGVPLALAAFAAGLAITEGPAAEEARRRLLPFRDVFAVLFFVALGTLIDPAALGRAAGWLFALLALLALGKVLVAYVLARLAALPVRPGQLAVGLGQMGEFSFVLASIALTAGVISAEIHTAVLGAVVVSVVTSTVLARRIGSARGGTPEARPG